MLKKTITYKDFDDVEQTDTLYFNLTKSEMMDMIDMQPRLEAWQNSVPSDPSKMDISAIKELLDIIKILLQKSYGQRSEDGKHFRKSKEALDDFLDSAVHDAFLYELFANPEQALEFMQGILPKDIATQAFAEAGQQFQSVVELPKSEGVVDAHPTFTAVEKEVPAYIRENRDPTQAELTAMTPSELQEAFRRKTSAQQ